MKEQEKRRKDAEKEELKKKKEEARAQQIATQTKKRGRNDCGKNDHETIARRRSTLRSRQDGTSPSRSKAPRLDTIISDDRCCACNQDFEEDVQLGAGIDWVQCVYTRWLHEECVIDCIIDANGKERLCPHCI